MNKYIEITGQLFVLIVQIGLFIITDMIEILLWIGQLILMRE